MGLEEEEGSGSQKGRPARVPEMSVTEMTVGRLLHASVLIGDGNGSYLDWWNRRDEYERK